MKRPSVKVQKALLRSMLRNFWRVANHPKLARWVFCYRTFFSEGKFRAVVEEMILCAGNWEAAAKSLRYSPALPKDSFEKLSKWAAAVKGGAL